jgi:NitT/TauT family transport system substrate-binding protein
VEIINKQSQKNHKNDFWNIRRNMMKKNKGWMLVVLAAASVFAGCSKPEKAGNEIVLQLCWLPQSEFMGFYTANDLGYYRDEGLTVTIVPGGGDITETAAVNSGIAHIGITPFINLMLANAGGMDFIQVFQVYQHSPLVLIAKKESGIKSGADFTAETKVGNWGLGYEYEVLALLQKYNLPPVFINQDFTMNAFDSGELDVASAMVYNELGLVQNSYEGALGYGDAINVITMDSEGVSMTGDSIFVNKTWAEKNRDTLVKFLRASIKGWKTACENTDAAAETVFKAGSSVSIEHQKYMARQVAGLVSVDSKGERIPFGEIGNIDDEALLRTMDIAKKYAVVADSQVRSRFQNLTIEELRTTEYWKEAAGSLK